MITDHWYIDPKAQSRVLDLHELILFEQQSVGSNLPVSRDMCKLLLGASNAQGFGTVLHTKNSPSVPPNLLCLSMLFPFPAPLIYVRGRRYMHISVGECVDWANGSYWASSSATVSLILWERSLSLNLQLILFGLNRKSESPSESGLYPSILGFPITTEPLSPIQSQLVSWVLEFKLWSSYLCIKQSSLLSPPSNQAGWKHKKREVGYKGIQIEHP